MGICQHHSWVNSFGEYKPTARDMPQIVEANTYIGEKPTGLLLKGTKDKECGHFFLRLGHLFSVDHNIKAS